MNMKKSTFALLSLSLLLSSVTTQTMDVSNWLKWSLTTSASFIKKKMMTQEEIESEARQAFENCIPAKDVRNIICRYIAPSKKPKVVEFINWDGEKVPVVIDISTLHGLDYNRFGFLTGTNTGFKLCSRLNGYDDQSFTLIFTDGNQPLKHNTEYQEAETRIGFVKEKRIKHSTRVFYNVDPSTFTKTDFENGKVLRPRDNK